MIAAEFDATGSVSTRWFQGFLAGKIEQFGAPGSGEASADDAPSDSASATTTRPAILLTTPLSAPARAGCTSFSGIRARPHRRLVGALRGLVLLPRLVRGGVREGRVGPDPCRVAAVATDDRGAELLHAMRHRPREAVDGRLLPERLLEPAGIKARDLRGVEPAEPLLQLQRACERGLDRHLLVEGEA